MNKILITAELLNEIVLKLSNVPAGQVYETLKKIEKEASESESNLNKYVTDEINKELLSQ
jgi:sugar-specific transcriptional regulator TrmB